MPCWTSYICGNWGPVLSKPSKKLHKKLKYSPTEGLDAGAFVQLPASVSWDLSRGSTCMWAERTSLTSEKVRNKNMGRVREFSPWADHQQHAWELPTYHSQPPRTSRGRPTGSDVGTHIVYYKIISIFQSVLTIRVYFEVWFPVLASKFA